MEENKGKIVEDAIKKSGYQIKALAERLGIARNTLYAKLRNGTLDDEFILKVGRVIHYDFSIHFPHLHKKDDPNQTAEKKGAYHLLSSKNPDFAKLHALDRKYLKLLEEYNKLLRLLILLANNNDLMGIKQEITEFLEEEEKDWENLLL
jgi:hypothetical protein